mmetsp:Transcript_86630/g.245272  ORF Transcript_86630/g.245272 Transcript_86630/m.245272 type:complete len:90 (+) Transcript_86630:167-436(+)
MGNLTLSSIVCIRKIPRRAHAAVNAQAMSRQRARQAMATSATPTTTAFAASGDPATPFLSRHPALPAQKKALSTVATVIQLVFIEIPDT